MSMSRSDLARARETAGRLLDALGIDAYLYELEPADGGWELRVECAVPEGWERRAWCISAEDLLASADDPSLRERLLRNWSEQLSGCRRRG